MTEAAARPPAAAGLPANTAPMSDGKASYRRILRSSSIIGGSSVVNIAIGMVRIKALAVLLGPAGVGLVGLYTQLMTTASMIATMGLGTVGARQVAEALGSGDERQLAVARKALLWSTLALAAAGALTVWSLRGVLAREVLGRPQDAALVGWLALGVALSVAGAAQGALIQGMRRIGDMARLSIYGSLANTALGLLVLWRWGTAGLTAFVLVAPTVGFLLGHWYVSRQKMARVEGIGVEELAAQWKTLLRLGVALMGAGLAGSLVQLGLRSYVGNRLGADALGHFQAALTISMQYIGFVLGAMGADYYPRLTGVIRDRQAAVALVNEQTEIALLLSTPVFLAMLALTPWVVGLLYSSAFGDTVSILRWQVVGDVLKVASWPLGFVILAAGDGRTFFWSETVTLGVMGVTVVLLLPVLGLQGTGVAFLACYVFYLPLVYGLARRRIGFRWSRAVRSMMAASLAACAATAVLAALSVWGSVLGCLLALGWTLFALVRIASMAHLPGSLARLGAWAQRLRR